MQTDPLHFKPVGLIHSCFKEKFGIPRQPGLVKSAAAELELLPPFNTEEALRGIDAFSHLWILFVFHQSLCSSFQPTVRPPRLGGNKRLGVFATRSPFRPNPIGLSVAELKTVRGTVLELAGGDFLDGTPVLDIKPYIPYTDLICGARGGFAADAPQPGIRVVFSPQTAPVLETLDAEKQQLIRDMLAYDPRPAYQQDTPDRLYGTRVFDLEVKWRHCGDLVTVETLQKG